MQRFQNVLIWRKNKIIKKKGWKNLEILHVHKWHTFLEQEKLFRGRNFIKPPPSPTITPLLLVTYALSETKTTSVHNSGVWAYLGGGGRYPETIFLIYVIMIVTVHFLNYSSHRKYRNEQFNNILQDLESPQPDRQEYVNSISENLSRKSSTKKEHVVYYNSPQTPSCQRSTTMDAEIHYSGYSSCSE